MASTQKKMVRSNKAQITYLCRYMAEHPNFAAGDYKTPQGAAVLEQQWVGLKEALDDLGPNRTVEQWKVCWRDQKRKARVEGGATANAIGATGNAVEIPELSENSAIILGTIGEEMASGFGPAESPIRFTAASTSSPLAPQSSPPAPRPSTSAVTLPTKRPTRSRVRKAHPPDRFLTAQETQNNILKELVQEVKNLNKLMQQQNKILQERNKNGEEQ